MFPKEDPEVFYIPPTCDDENQSVSAKGCSYNYYKIVRKDFRDARMLDLQSESTTENNQLKQNDNIDESKKHTCLIFFKSIYLSNY